VRTLEILALTLELDAGNAVLHGLEEEAGGLEGHDRVLALVRARGDRVLVERGQAGEEREAMATAALAADLDRVRCDRRRGRLEARAGRVELGQEPARVSLALLGLVASVELHHVLAYQAKKASGLSVRSG